VLQRVAVWQKNASMSLLFQKRQEEDVSNTKISNTAEFEQVNPTLRVVDYFLK